MVSLYRGHNRDAVVLVMGLIQSKRNSKNVTLCVIIAVLVNECGDGDGDTPGGDGDGDAIVGGDGATGDGGEGEEW